MVQYSSVRRYSSDHYSALHPVRVRLSSTPLLLPALLFLLKPVGMLIFLRLRTTSCRVEHVCSMIISPEYYTDTADWERITAMADSYYVLYNFFLLYNLPCIDW